MFEIKLPLIKIKNLIILSQGPLKSNFDRTISRDWLHRSNPNPHQSVPLVVMGVSNAFRHSGSMFKVPMSAEYFFMEDPPKIL